MKQAEMIDVIEKIKGAWPRFEAKKETFEAYMFGLGDLTYEGVSRAVGELMRVEEWPPTIAKIRRVYYENAGIPNHHQAWATVLKISKRGRQAVEPLYRGMDPMTVAALREAGGFIQLWNLETVGEIEGMKRTFVEVYKGLYAEEIRKPVMLAAKLGVAIEGSGNEQLESGK